MTTPMNLGLPPVSYALGPEGRIVSSAFAEGMP